jgi:hypothetical protein
MALLQRKANCEGNKQGLDDFSPIPAGKYAAIIYKSEFKKTKDKKGNYLQIQLKVVNGDHKGKVLFDRLNLDNVNPIAVQIANKTLNTICKACGKFGVEDSEELHGIPMLVTVAVKPATSTHAASNEIKYYAPCENGTQEAPPTGEVQETPTKEVIEEKEEAKNTQNQEVNTQNQEADVPKERKRLPWE